MATDSHMQNAPKKPSPNKNDSPQQESYCNQQNLLQNVDNSSISHLHGVERSRESSRSVEHLHETPPNRSEKRSREDSSGKSIEKSKDEKRSKHSHHSHSQSPKREGHSPASLKYSNESFQKRSEKRSREESRGKSSERSRNEKRSKQGHHSHSKSREREKSRTPHSPESVEYSNESFQKMSENRSREESRGKSSERSRNEKSSKHSHHSDSKSHEDFESRKFYFGDSRNQKVLAKSQKKSISPIIFDKSINSCKVEDEDFKSRKIYMEDSLKLINQDRKMDKKEHFCFFFGKDSPFSNFHSAAFEVQGIWYCCSEQFMMHQKAVLFDDKNHAHLIMRATDPREMKKLGRKVEKFNPYVWGKESEEIVKVGIKAKFEQNEKLKKALIATFPRILVEAAPRDRLWGIGMGSSNKNAYCRLTWKGQNKLGYLLTKIRNEIMEKEGLFSELSGV
ncbi:uncharacterized protein LOC111118880 isoform X1 [Crassostrea virginica]